jgi:rSAM/selenodomain-associated transferase 2
MEIIVVDGEKKGGTLRAISPKGLKTVLAPRGRGAQMNHGAAIASGSIFLFLHADTLLPEDAPQAILEACKPPHIAGGTFTLGIDARGKAFRAIEALVRLRTRLSRIPYGDQGIFIKKSIFHELGGYPEIPIMEDVALMDQLKRRGKKIAILPETVSTCARRWKKEGLCYCTLRNRILMLLYASGVAPSRLARFYP